MTTETASAGTLESSDCLVTVTLSGNGIEYEGANSSIFLSRTERIVREAMEKYSVDNASIRIQDQGALELTLRARVETAIERALGGA
ncbi:MAG: citrate lyase acyl carrier protein [Synergistaceae bacterium]|jgi:citrate lyase subunit gamma (acyl carrier protein)|nr:citrate lyase acyl carrier protein [Synergistaceae bacterium]